MVPDDWEIKEIGFRYIVLQTDAGPVLEVKWNRVKGNFSHRRHLKRLTKSNEKKTVRRAAESPLPDAWQSALTEFESTGFSWQGWSQRGMGVLLFCPACRNATLIQFIENGRGIKKTVSQRILASFRDHTEAPVCRWAVFDIRADLPESLRLKRYRFEPGKFELAFSSKTRQVTLLRWAPASIILSGTSLETFADRAIAFSPGNAFRLCADPAQPTVEWKTEPSANWRTRLGQAFKKKYPFKHARCWHLADKNRILGIKIEGQAPINPAEMERLCIAYESL
jgi:hypothetical protein